MHNHIPWAQAFDKILQTIKNRKQQPEISSADAVTMNQGENH
jgi:hypothetical protein